MSLIDEALRRAQDATSATQSAAPPRAPQTTAPPPQPTTGVHSWPTTPPPPVPDSRAPISPAAIALLIGLGLGLGWLVWRGGEPRVGISPARPSAISPVDAPRAKQLSGPWSTPPKPSALALTGIVEGLGEPYALINGEIARVGTQIADATVIAIARGAVRLRLADGSETTLHVSD